MGRVKKKPVLALLCVVLSILTIIAMMPGMAYADDEKATNGSAENNPEQVEETSGDLAAPTLFIAICRGGRFQSSVQSISQTIKERL